MRTFASEASRSQSKRRRARIRCVIIAGAGRGHRARSPGRRAADEPGALLLSFRSRRPLDNQLPRPRRHRLRHCSSVHPSVVHGKDRGKGFRDFKRAASRRSRPFVVALMWGAESFLGWGV